MPSEVVHSIRDTLSPSPDIEVSLTASVTSSPSKLKKAARLLELQRNEAQLEIEELKCKLELARPYYGEDSSVISVTTQKRRREPDSDEDESDLIEMQTDKVVNAGRKFVIIYGLWLQLGLCTFQVSYDADVEKEQRFENVDNKVQGQIREIRELLGGLAISMSSSPWIGKAVISGMKTQCSNTATRLRRQCAALLEVNESDLRHANSRREKFRERIGWVDNGHGFGSYSSVDVEVIHKEYTGSFNYDKIFLNPVLMRIFVAIIRGPTTALEFLNGIISYPKTETMARKHGIRHTTPGAIAACAILTRWVLSADECLQSTGAITGICYSKDFDDYLEILTKGLQRKKRGIIAIFTEWDRAIFPNSDSSLGSPQQDASRGLRRVLNMMDADSSDDGDSVNGDEL